MTADVPRPAINLLGIATVLLLLVAYRVTRREALTADEKTLELGRANDQLSREIQERKTAVAAVRRLSCVVEQSMDGIIIASLAGEVEFVNEAYAAMHGYSREEIPGLIGLPLSHFYAPSFWQGGMPDIMARLAANGSVQGETIHIKKDGSTFVGWGSAVVLTDDSGEPSGVSSLLRDVTEQRRAATELSEARDKAESASRAKSYFLANMTHELRTPLNTIVGYAEMLRDECLDKEQASMAVDLGKIHQAGVHLLRVINDLLDLSKIEAGKMTLNHETFDLGATIDQLAGLVEPMAKRGQNRFEITRDGTLPWVEGDETKLMQILLNLLANACKFTERGAVRLNVASEIVGTRLSLSIIVEDTGIGIDPSEQAAIFEAFNQGRAGRSPKSRGTGLGLAITARFVEMFGGSISVESRLGYGSRFSVRLPLALASGKPARPRMFEPKQDAP